MKSIRHSLFETIDLEARVTPAHGFYAPAAALPVPPDQSAFRFPFESGAKAAYPDIAAPGFAAELADYFSPAFTRPAPIAQGTEVPPVDPDYAVFSKPMAFSQWLHTAVPTPAGEIAVPRSAGDPAVHPALEIAAVPDADEAHPAAAPNRLAVRTASTDGIHGTDGTIANLGTAHGGTYLSAAVAAEEGPAEAVETPSAIPEPPTVPDKEPTAVAFPKSLPEVAWSLVPSAGDVSADIAAVEAGARDLLRHLAGATAAVDWESDGDRLLVFSSAFVGAAGLGCAVRSSPPARRFRRSPFSPEPTSHDPSPAR